MSPTATSIPALDEIRQLNRVFLNFLRAEADIGRAHLGLSAGAAAEIRRASPGQIERAADFPRALFRLRVPTAVSDTASKPVLLSRSARWSLHLTLLHSARHLSQLSGYAARLLLRLGEDEVRRLRTTAVSDVLTLSRADDLVCAFDDRGWIWRELLTETRPAVRRQLLLIGFQPELGLPAAASGLEQRGIRI